MPDKTASVVRAAPEPVRPPPGNAVPHRDARTDRLGAQALPVANVRPRRPKSKKKPRWDADAHQLLWRGAVIKTFRHDAANQRRVLQAFQDLDWPSRIDDPLPVTASVRRKLRLRETVKSLNRSLRGAGIRFRMDGTTTGAFWEIEV
jgi:hypothetical protein